MHAWVVSPMCTPGPCITGPLSLEEHLPRRLQSPLQVSHVPGRVEHAWKALGGVGCASYPGGISMKVGKCGGGASAGCTPCHQAAWHTFTATAHRGADRLSWQIERNRSWSRAGPGWPWSLHPPPLPNLSHTMVHPSLFESTLDHTYMWGRVPPWGNAARAGTEEGALCRPTRKSGGRMLPRTAHTAM